jgi:hypothetical protein
MVAITPLSMSTLYSVILVLAIPVSPVGGDGRSPGDDSSAGGTKGAAKKDDAKAVEIQKLLAETRGTDTFRLLQIAGLASQYGLKRETLDACDRALDAKAEAARVEPLLRPFAEKEFADVTGSRRATHAQKLLNAMGPKSTRADAIYTRLALGGLTNDERIHELEHALNSPVAATRRFATEMWGQVAPNDRLELLVKRTLCDKDDSVRDTASKVLATRPDPKITARFSKYLNETSPSVRIRSAEALGNLGQLDAVPSLIRELVMLHQAGSASYAPRAFFFAGTQQAYVSDYNVEVAQASAIADPVVDTLQSGVCLDVRVLGVQVEKVITMEKRAAQNALAKIAGKDLGSDPKAWAQWYQDQRKSTGVNTNQDSPADASGPASRKSF